MTNADPLSLVLDRLEQLDCRPRGWGRKWSARCPAHADRRPSLSIAEGVDGQVLLKCHAGCDTAEVLGELDLTWADLYPPDSRRNGDQRNGRQPPASRKRANDDEAQPRWDEEDAFAWLRRKTGIPRVMATGLGVRFQDGALCLTWPGIEARMVRPGPAGDWFWQADDAEGRRPDLWPLPLFPPRTVWLTEGASDCLALRAAGLPAYASVKGAARDLGRVLRALREAGVEEVVLAYDLDIAGRGGTERAAKAAAQAGLRVRCLDLPPSLALLGGKDICDLLATLGGDVRRLRETAEGLAGATGAPAALPGQSPGAATSPQTNVLPVGGKVLAAADILAAPTAESLESLPLLGQDSILIKGWSHLLAAPPKCGKTEMVWACVQDWDSQGVKVLWVSEESEAVWAQRLKRDEARVVHVRWLLAAGLPQEDILRNLAQAAPDFDVVVVDTLRHLFQVDEGDNAAIARTITALDEAIGRGRTRIYLHHTRKAPGQHGERTAGGLAFVGGVDRQLELSWDEHDDSRRLLKGVSRIAPVPELLLGWEDGRLQVLGNPSAVALDQVKERVLGVLSDEWQTTAQVLDKLADPKPSDQQVRTALKSLALDGLVERDPSIILGDRPGKAYRWRLPPWENLSSNGLHISLRKGCGQAPEAPGPADSYEEDITDASRQARLTPGPAGSDDLIQGPGAAGQERDGPSHDCDARAEIGPEEAAPEEGSSPAAVVVPQGSSADGDAGRLEAEEPNGGDGGEAAFPAEVQRLLKVAEASTCPRCGSLDIGVPTGERLGHLLCLACLFC